MQIETYLIISFSARVVLIKYPTNNVVCKRKDGSARPIYECLNQKALVRMIWSTLDVWLGASEHQWLGGVPTYSFNLGAGFPD